MLPSTRRFLGLCFFLSGATGLILEVVWTKDLSYFLGNTLHAVSTVVAAFMAGLGLGGFLAARFAARNTRSLWVYAALEALIGLCGLSFHQLFRCAAPVFAALYRSVPGGGLFLLLRFLAVFLLLLLPTTLMGMSLPVVVGAFARRRRTYETETGLVYGLNALGAVVGTLGAGFLLVPKLGLHASSLAAGLTDLAIAAAAVLLARREGRLPAKEFSPAEAVPASLPAAGWTRRQLLVALLYGASGLIALAYEVAWFRLLGMILGPSVYAFAAMLAVYLAGIGIGSGLAVPWLRRSSLSGLNAMVVLEAALGLLTLLQMSFWNALPRLQGMVFSSAARVMGGGAFDFSLLVLSAVVVLPPCLLLGALFPVVVRAVREAGPAAAPESQVGRIYMLNTAGGIAGSLLAGFLFLPHLGLQKTLLFAALGSLVVAELVLLLSGALRPPARRPAAAAAGLALLGLACSLFLPPWNTALFNLGLYQDAYSATPAGSRHPEQEQLLYHREGLNASVAVFKIRNNAALYVSGKPDASLATADLYTQLFLGHLPVALAARPGTVAVIGYGSGMTAAAVLAHPEVRKMDIIEIEQAVMDASPYFEAINGNPLRDPRTRLILEDGRTHLGCSQDRYDVITSEPSNPWMAGVANLFTTDFYRAARARLNPGGVFAQWIQNYGLSEESFRTILASLCAVFPHVTLFCPAPGDFIVLASAEPLSLPWEIFRARFENPQVQSGLRRLGISDPLQLAFFFQGPETALRRLVAGWSQQNTDDNAFLEYRLPRELLQVGRLRAGRASPGLLVAKACAGSRIEGLQQLLPGLPLGPCLAEIAAYPRSQQPNPLKTDLETDPWWETRVPLLAGLQEELRRHGQPGLADQLGQIDAKAAEQGAARERWTATLRSEVRSDGQPSPESLSRALEEAPDLAFAWMLLGQTLLAQNQLEGSERAYDSALELARDQVYQQSLLGLAEVARARGQVEEAIRHCRAAADWNPYFLKSHLLLATILLEQGRTSEALSAAGHGLQFNPGEPALLDLYRWAAGKQFSGAAPGALVP